MCITLLVMSSEDTAQVCNSKVQGSSPANCVINFSYCGHLSKGKLCFIFKVEDIRVKPDCSQMDILLLLLHNIHLG